MTISTLFESMEYGPAPESPAAAEAWLNQHNRTFSHFIGNTWVGSETQPSIDVLNPATGEPIATIADGNQADINLAVESARKAFTSWSKRSGHERARYLYAIA